MDSDNHKQIRESEMPDHDPPRVRFIKETDNRESTSQTLAAQILDPHIDPNNLVVNTLEQRTEHANIHNKKFSRWSKNISALPQSSAITPRMRERVQSFRRSILNQNLNYHLWKDNYPAAESRPDRGEIFQNLDTLADPDITEQINSKCEAHLSQNNNDKKSSIGSGGSVSPEANYPTAKPTATDRKTRFSTSSSCYDRLIQLGVHSDFSVRYRARSWRKAICKRLFGPTEIPPSKNGRCIELDATRVKAFIDERTGKEYISNTIRSSRYTLWNFIPRQLFFQFSKLANAYFLLVSILQIIPGLSTTGTYTTIAPLMVFVAISMGKEGFDDIRRYRLDKVENSRDILTLHTHHSCKGIIDKTSHKTNDESLSKIFHVPGSSEESNLESADSPRAPLHWIKVKCQDARVGDIVKLRRNDPVPADIVLLYADGPNGIAYIETMALDGETNLKSKQAPTLLSKKYNAPEKIVTCHFKIVVEDPNIDLYNFDGHMTIDNETLPLTTNEVVFRGSTLRNTSTAIGIVINTGEECKIRMNANKNPRIKAPELQKITNQIVVYLVLFVFLLTLSCTIAYQIWSATIEKKAFYLEGVHINFARIFIGFFILYNTLIPLSLYVSLEVIKVGQMFLMNDLDIYDPVSDTPMIVNTTTILENLGQVNYIFSDKTGTLTENVMRFRKLSVAGYSWLHDFDLIRESNSLDQYREVKKNQSSKKGKILSRRSYNLDYSDTLTPSLIKSGSVHRSDSIWRSTAQSLNGINQTQNRTEELLWFMKYKPQCSFTKKVRLFMLSLSLCHTCLPELHESGKIEFQAASPDELALVQAAQDLGWLVINRAAKSITLTYPEDSDSFSQKTEVYDILDVIEFSSKRKRMSVIVRFPNGKIFIFCKGADSVISSRLKNPSFAMQKKTDIVRKSSLRKSMEAEHALRRLSLQSSVASFRRTSLSLSRRRSTGQPRSSTTSKRLQPIRDELDSWLRNRELSTFELSHEYPRPALSIPSTSSTENSSTLSNSSPLPTGHKILDSLVDEKIVLDESAVLERCFQHVEDFSSEGLRTLLYGHRNLDEEEYASWKKIYVDATTSLVDRQELIERAGEMIEKDFDLTGGTAIEDKLQKGVPETIDKLRRANIKIWMLTGDKRETAINIAHSARICKSYSNVVILDYVDGNIQETMNNTLQNINNGTTAHTVIVVDGQTLTQIDTNHVFANLFFELVVLADSVICCRASPSQKASLVKRVRLRVAKSTTLAIGDGSNDISMILEAHVGIGISGKEGLQAARISDYSIAQFRFLQKLLLVHGHWNYIRTGKYILATFWKELVFYLLQALYQNWAGYTGTSLFESTSLTVFNTLFTSLSVVILGIFEQDLNATTLLAVPELYVQGQRDEGFNIKKYISWMITAIFESLIIFFTMYGLFGIAVFTRDDSLLSMGTLCFTVSLIFINTKLLLIEMHNKTFLSFGSWAITVVGWFFWQMLLSGVFKPGSIYPLYPVKDGFLHNFGTNALWWLVIIIGIACVIVLELGVISIRKTFWPSDIDVFQELQRDSLIRKRFEDTLEAELHGDVAGVEMGIETTSNGLYKGDIQALLSDPEATGCDKTESSPNFRRAQNNHAAIGDNLVNTLSFRKDKMETNNIEMAGRGYAMRHSIDVAELMRKAQV